MYFEQIFFINSALNAKRLSIFSNEQRFEQTLETIDSIDKHCPDSAKFIIDSSSESADETYIKTLAEKSNVWFIDMSSHEAIKLFSQHGLRSQAETLALIGFMKWFENQNIQSKRIYKLSGRYTLTENFIVDNPVYKDSFVFSNALESWMPEEQKKMSNVDRLYRLRLWHMDYNLLKTFSKELNNIFDDCSQYHIDVEHSYYKHLHKYKVIEVDKIGVKGIIAPSGEVIDE